MYCKGICSTALMIFLRHSTYKTPGSVQVAPSMDQSVNLLPVRRTVSPTGLVSVVPELPASCTRSTSNAAPCTSSNRRGIASYGVPIWNAPGGGTSSGCCGCGGQCRDPSGAGACRPIPGTQRVHVVMELASQAVPRQPRRVCPRVTLGPRHCCGVRRSGAEIRDSSSQLQRFMCAWV